ncbi:uncharacterized protein J8A68_004903 [[Candida] subhashii]|uniref:Peptide hydrolase n=1 Tax=[Candida] subhashii TaxID=561895 RepID=A0A8J5Q4X4_9ASCO|nr:uncharacterized protein J8A68_004903 [[Candida] subhashii]KAG7661634.1 hypothetical protein J8A68_004903 [[Candida] subhashii]
MTDNNNRPLSSSRNGEGESNNSTTRSFRGMNGNGNHQQRQGEHDNPNMFIRFFRSVFGYRKTSLTLFVFLTIFATGLLSFIDNNLEFTIDLPSDNIEKEILDMSWLDLQKIASHQHTYGSHANDKVHDYLEKRISLLTRRKPYGEYDNDLDTENRILFNTGTVNSTTVAYYESNNVLARINGTDPALPALLLSAHYDSVPSSFGVTDDGMGIASLLGVLTYFTEKSTPQPKRTIIFNFNNNEEFGLYGASAFLSHPWSEQVKFFLNLEGTGAGGKAILFRGTDYGVTKFFRNVRYPYATSMFQQGFNNRLIHSETDYKIYTQVGGLRGLDLAFFRPRDIYHTASDNIRNVNIKSLWHMLSNSLDFTNSFVNEETDLDFDNDETNTVNNDFAAYMTFLNFFFVMPISSLILINSILLILVPLLSVPLLVIILKYRQNWQLTAVNVLKFPIAVTISTIVLNMIVTKGFQTMNQYLPSSNPMLLVATTTSILMIIYYLCFNAINLVFINYKVLNHDEKLIVIVETSFLYWLALIYITSNFTQNELGNDHTGEFPVAILFTVQAAGALLGLLGWSFAQGQKIVDHEEEEASPLLGDDAHQYGAGANQEEDGLLSPQSTTSYLEDNEGNLQHLAKHFGYDWSLQYLVIVPLSSLIVYNSGWLIINGLNKSIQESLASEELIYGLIQLFAQVWVLPFLPFIFKFNRVIVMSLTLFAAMGVTFISFLEPFNAANPLKLRVIQQVDLVKSSTDSYVRVFGREGVSRGILEDLPSVKVSGENVTCDSLADGNEVCSYRSVLPPNIIPEVKDFNDYLQIQIVKNSTENHNLPYGLLQGEIRIKAPENRMCNLNFDKTNKIVGKHNYRDSPVKTVIVYAEKNNDTKSMNLNAEVNNIPNGFSRDDDGNYLFKDVSGIDSLYLNKLDWENELHIGFQWLPNVIDSSSGDINTLGVHIECFWADLSPVKGDNGVDLAIPAYEELLHYSPNYVSWANRDRGLLSVSTHVQV